MSNNIRDAILAQIRAEMAYQDIKQKDLAQTLGMDAAVLSRYMRAKRDMPMDIYLRISEALDLPPNYIMSKAVEKSK